MVSQISLLSARRRATKSNALIYFVCGNPGLISFYVDFLSFLRGLLDSAEEQTAYDIYGRNLLGFSDDDHEPFGPGNEPYNLEGQIEGIYDDVSARRANANGEQRPYDFVILMGHSVGTYISVEIFNRHMKQGSDRAPHLHLRHGFLLCPTLTDLAMSPSGRRLSSLMRVSFLEASVHIWAQYLVSVFPERSLWWIVENIMGFSPHTADVTAKWLKSRDGVWQAIHLGKSELRDISEDKWEEELWEVTGQGSSDAPKFFMLYAKEDHWIADHLRDAFIEKRREHGERGGRTRILIDEGDIKHAFCTKEISSWAVARTVADWVQELDEVSSTR